MKNQLINVLNTLFMLFVMFFLALFEKASIAADQKNLVLKPSHKSVLLASGGKPDQKKKTRLETSKSHNLQKEQNVNSSEGNQRQSAKIQNNKLSSYSFRPLLIQGKKRLIQKTKEMKVESGNIVESQLFFIDIDFKKRIFETEDIN